MDTQNQAWATDTSTFGYQMLLKMGWSEGKGLGRNEDGMSSHIRVKRKVESEGIGFVEDGQGNTAFVHQIQSFNQILEGLNESISKQNQGQKKKKKEKGKKRNHKISSDEEGAKEAEKVEKRSKKRKKKLGLVKKKQKKGKDMAVQRKHAKFLKAKNVKGYSAADLKAILGGNR